MNKESVVIAGECLRFIMLLQTHSITDELQRGFMSLFLEVVLVVFSKTSDGVSQVRFLVRPVNSILEILLLVRLKYLFNCFMDNTRKSSS